jgi:hypothetical protein
MEHYQINMKHGLYATFQRYEDKQLEYLGIVKDNPGYKPMTYKALEHSPVTMNLIEYDFRNLTE